MPPILRLSFPFLQTFSCKDSWVREERSCIVSPFQQINNKGKSLVINLLMINLQSSKKLIKNYDQILNQTLLKSNTSLTNPSSKDTYNIKDQKSQQPNLFGRTISKMVKIEFLQHSKSKQPPQIKLKRKIMSSGEKHYLHKKNNYYSSIKNNHQMANQQRTNREHQNSINLTVGSHAIQKIDYNTFFFAKDCKEKEQSFSFKKRLKSKIVNLTDFNIVPKQTAAKVLILKKSEKNRVEEFLFQTTITSRTQAPKNIQKTKDNLTITYTGRQAKNYSIQSFIPIRKNTTKKEPFVFGLGQKQINFQKNRQKLVNYHDFLWKINYSNGLYIKPSDQDSTYKAYVGPGNNSNLIKSIIKRRYWWSIAEKWQGCNFVWTQLKVNAIFKQQKASETKPLKIYSKSAEIQNNHKTQPIFYLQQGHEKIFNKNDLLNWDRHMKKHRRSEAMVNDKTYKNRAQFFNGREIIRIQNSTKLNVHNHLEQNYYIGNKKSLFYHFKKYYELQKLNVFEALPMTFHLAKGLQDSQFEQFQRTFMQIQLAKRKGEDIKNVWIMKPGQNSNRGNGITVCYSLEDIKLRLRAKQKNSDGSLRTFIIQKYMEKPLLYKGRKFDLRHYMLLTCFNGILKAYWFPQGYIRTSSSPYCLKRGTNLLIHLTNDAVQKNAGDYGKFQKGNKISYQKFETYLNKSMSADQNNYFSTQILPQMKHLATQAIKSTYLSLDPYRKQHNFELLGMDFMIDQKCKPWLIEINTNPCLQLSCPLLSRIIPSLVEQTIRICVDPFFPPPEEWSSNKKMHLSDNMLQDNKFELIFDQSVDGEGAIQILGGNLGFDSNMGKIEQDAELFQNDGSQEWQQKQV